MSPWARRVWVIARHEYLVNIRRPGFIIVTLAIPALGLLTMGVAYLFGGEAADLVQRTLVTEQTFGVVDSVGRFTPVPEQYATRFVAFPDETAGRAALDADEVDVLLVVPEDYMANGTVRVLSKGGGFSAAMIEDSSLVRSYFVNALLDSELQPLDDQVRARLVRPVTPSFVDLTADSPDPEGFDVGIRTAINIMVPYGLSVLLIVTVFMSSGYLLRSVSEEKTSRVIEIVISSVTPRQLLAGKVIGLGALGLTQVAVWLTTAVVLSGGMLAVFSVAIPVLVRPEILLLSVVYYVLGFLIYAVMTGSVGALGTNMQESQQLAGIFTFFAAVPLMMAGFMFQDPNMPLARVLSWFPLTAPTMMLLRVPMSDVPTSDIVGSIVMTSLAVPVILWAGAKVFRMGLLMYGKRPGVREVWRSLREA